MAHMDMMIPQMCVLTIMLYIFEMIMYFIFKLQKKEENSGLKSWEDKVGVVILCVFCKYKLPKNAEALPKSCSGKFLKVA